MAKPNPLMQGLKSREKPAAPLEMPSASAAQAPPRMSGNIPPSRVGRVLVGGHFAPEVQTALKIIAAEERSSVQALLAEGIDAVFARRHKAQIASLTAVVGRAD